MEIDRGVHCMSKVFDENLSCSADMQSSLRYRIAAVLKEHRQVASSCECGFDLGLSAITWRWHDHLADAVIDVLADVAEDCRCQLRYLYEWETDGGR